MLKPTKILVPTDFSAHSDKALKQALDLAAEYKAKVYVVHVVHEGIHSSLTDDYPGISITAKEIQNLEKNILNRARERLTKQLDKFPESKKLPVIQKVTSGVAYEEILREQDERGIDLIVISSLGRTGMAKYLIGSVARNVLKGAKCSVLLTK